MDKHKQYWFRARRIGFGWGLPQTWQGTLTLLVYIAVIATLVALAHHSSHPLQFRLGCAAATLALIGVYAWKGEPLH